MAPIHIHSLPENQTFSILDHS